jgi:hypothetical protein
MGLNSQLSINLEIPLLYRCIKYTLEWGFYACNADFYYEIRDTIKPAEALPFNLDTVALSSSKIGPKYIDFGFPLTTSHNDL